MKFKKIYISLFVIAVLLANCEDLEKLNENPNQPEEVSSEVLLTSAIRSSVNSMVLESFLLGNNIAQLTAKTLRTEVDVYSWNAFPTVWEEMYKSVANVIEVEKIAMEENDTNMEAVAKIMKSWIFSILTMAYGDIPYSDAVEGVASDNWFPAYDDQQTIITGTGGLLDVLATANNLLGSDENGAIEGDILFNGDKLKWQKFANSLRLRLLMHVSNKVDVSAEFFQIVNNFPIMSSIDDGAVLVYTGTFPNEYPIVPLKQGDFDAVVLSTSAVTVMDNYQDPRLGVYARPANITDVAENPSVMPVYDGAVNGLETGGCDKSGSRLGLAYYDYPNHPSFSDKANGILMSYAEVEFLLAEASQKNWLTDDTEAHYQSAIHASMDYYGVDYPEFGWVDFSDYYANSGVAFDNTLESIWEQKWLSLFFHGLEPYFELRRWMYEEDFQWSALGFVFPPCQNTNDDALPLRFLYPGNEQSLNPQNYNNAISALGQNSQNAKMWLME